MNPLRFSHHEGISCDKCLKPNFPGKRFKCLVCKDYDLCASCYENGNIPLGKEHSSDHPVQCILTKNDYEIYFGGESVPVEQPQSFTCPICGKMGFTENLLYDHATQEHSDNTSRVFCPICCFLPTTDLNTALVDFSSHLTNEHRNRGSYDTSQSNIRGRRIPNTHRTLNTNRNRRQLNQTTVNMLSSINPLLGSLSNEPTSSSSQVREIDQIYEILSHIRRSQTVTQSSLMSNNNSSNTLYMQMDRNLRTNSIRQALDRNPEIVLRRHNQNSNQQTSQQTSLALNGTNLSYLLLADTPSNQLNAKQTTNQNSLINNSLNQTNGQASGNQHQFLLPTCTEKPKTDKEIEDADKLKLEKSLFVEELLISSLENFFKHDLNFKKKAKTSHNSLDEENNDSLEKN